MEKRQQVILSKMREGLEMEKREIKLSDLICDICIKWKVILLWMLIGAVVLGCFSYVRSVNRASLSVEESQDIEAIIQSLSEKDLITVQTVVSRKELISKLQQSAVMQFDANSISRSELILGIAGANEDQICDIVSAYKEWTQTIEFAEYISSRVPNICADDILDLVRLQSQLQAVGLDEKGRGSEEYLLSFVIMGADRSMCEEISKYVISFFYEKSSSMKKIFGNHELMLLSNYSTCLNDSRVNTFMLNKKIQIQTLLSKNETDINSFTAEQKIYYSILTEEGIDDVADLEVDLEQTISREPPCVNFKYVILGAFVAAFSYIFILFVKYITDTTIRISDDYMKLYRIPLLGSIPYSSEKKFFGSVDNWISRLRYGKKRVNTPEEAMQLAIAMVKLTAHKHAIQEIACVGCNMNQVDNEFFSALENGLEKEGIGVYQIGNVLYNAEAVDKIAKVKAVVLLEKAGVTTCDEVVQEIFVLDKQGISVLGMIVAD